MKILMQWTYLLLLSTSSLVSAFKMNVSKMAAIMNQTVFRAFKKAYPSYLARLFLFAACLPPKALKSRFRSKAVLHPSLFPSTNISLISNGVINLVQSSPSVHPTASMKTPQNTKNWILIVEKILVLFAIALTKFFYSFIWRWH